MFLLCGGIIGLAGVGLGELGAAEAGLNALMGGCFWCSVPVIAFAIGGVLRATIVTMRGHTDAMIQPVAFDDGEVVELTIRGVATGNMFGVLYLTDQRLRFCTDKFNLRHQDVSWPRETLTGVVPWKRRGVEVQTEDGGGLIFAMERPEREALTAALGPG